MDRRIPGIASGRSINAQAKLRAGMSVRSTNQAKSVATTRLIPLTVTA
jgi:hypothetical protein